MQDYEKMYRELFRAATKAIELLQQAQIKTEEMYISSKEPVIELIQPERKTMDGDAHE